MKLTILLSLALVLQLNAAVHSQGSQFDLSVENQEIRDVLKELENQSKYRFFYSEDFQLLNKRVRINAINASMENILDELLKNSQLTYRIFDDNLVVIVPSDDIEQGNKVTGKITDSEGNPLPGVNIVEVGTTNGAVTDTEGNYTITVSSEDPVLRFSFVGYLTEEVDVSDRTSLDLVLVEDVQALDEVVVVGYSTQSKRDIISAVSSVDVEEISNLPVTNVAQSLQGRVSGVTVSQGGGPGGESVIRIRGYGTTRNNNPLIIVDGVQMQGNSDSKSAGGLDAINPNDIESMQVLKDATSAAIYGARAANGVIIITTKKGKKGKPVLSVDAQYGVSAIPQSGYPDMLNPQQMADLYFDVNQPTTDPYYGTSPTLPDYLIVDGSTSFGVSEGDSRANPDLYNYSLDENRYLIAKANKAGTNWLNELLQPGVFQKANVTASGGGEAGNYLFSLGVLDREGTTQLTDFKRYNFRVNTQFQPIKWLTIGENLSFVYNENRGGGSGDFFNAMVQYPILPTTDIFGNPVGSRYWRAEITNPIANLQRAQNNVGQRFRTLGNIYLGVDILKNLTFKTDYSINFFTYNKSSYSFPNVAYERQGESSNELENENQRLVEWVWNNTLTYNLSLEKHSLNLLAGTEAVENNYQQMKAANNEFLLSDLDFMILNAGTGTQTNEGRVSDWSLWSYFGRLDYSFDNRYLLGAIIRRDATSRFLNDKWGTFPAVSAGWRISEESFMSGISAINDFKIRGGWGQTGNQDIGIAYPGYTTFEVNDETADYPVNGSNNTVVRGFIRDREGAPDLRWETTTSTNIGFDLGLFDKLYFSADYWIRETEDMLTQASLSPQSGEQSAPYINFGTMENTGIDLQLSFADVIGTDLSYNVSLTATHYKNELVSINEDPETFDPGTTREGFTVTRSTAGQPISSFYVYEHDGIWQSQEEIDNSNLDQDGAEVGHFRYKDRTGDNVIDDDDRFYAGSPHPDFSYGLNLNVGYKNFDLLAFFEGVQGREVYNFMKVYTHMFNATNQPDANKNADVLNAWRPDNQSAELPLLGGNRDDATPSTFFIEDASYLRFKNLQLGYTLPTSLTNRVGIANFRIFLQGENVFVFTNYSGMEPEVSVFGRGNEPGDDIGVDAGTLPLPRTFLVGVNLKF